MLTCQNEIQTSIRESSRWDDRWRVEPRDQEKQSTTSRMVVKFQSTGLETSRLLFVRHKKLVDYFRPDTANHSGKSQEKENPTHISMQRLYSCEGKNSRHKYNIWEKKNTRIHSLIHLLEREAPKA